eukprot:3215597-Karenia_brevis.AAC.1
MRLGTLSGVHTGSTGGKRLNLTISGSAFAFATGSSLGPPGAAGATTVSYTHLTLPTICSV